MADTLLPLSLLRNASGRSCTSLSSLSDKTLSILVHRLPKVDLHCHLEGAIFPETLLRIAEKHGIELPTYDLDALRPLVQVTNDDKTLLDFLKKFEVIGKVFVSTAVITALTRGVIEQAAHDNIKYLELRFAPVYMASAGSLDPNAVIEAVIEGAEQGSKEWNLPVNLIVVIERNRGVQKAWDLLTLTSHFGPHYIRAIDLADDEARYPAEPYAPVFQAAKQKGFKAIVHAGEAGPARNIEVAVEALGADRGGHFVRAYQDKEVEELLLRKGIPLELCRTSNEQTGAIEKGEPYPIKRYLDKGLIATLNTDDPGISGITLSSEYAKVTRESDLSWHEVSTLIRYGIISSFLDIHQKATLFEESERTLDDIERTILFF